MTNSELAGRFANGATKGKGSNMYIDDDTIFSYGRHFPIARRIGPGEFVVNVDTRSATTSKHQAYIRGALYGKTIWEAPGAREDKIAQYAYFRADYLQTKILSARSLLPQYLLEFEAIAGYWKRCRERFNLDHKELDFILQFRNKDAIRTLSFIRRLDRATGVA